MKQVKATYINHSCTSTLL